MPGANILLAAATLLSNSGKWCQGARARDAQGRPCMVLDRQAVCWCLTGSIRKVANDAVLLGDVYHYVLQASGLDSAAELSDWNDEEGRTAGQVVALLLKAFDLARFRSLA